MHYLLSPVVSVVSSNRLIEHCNIISFFMQVCFSSQVCQIKCSYIDSSKEKKNSLSDAYISPVEVDCAVCLCCVQFIILCSQGQDLVSSSAHNPRTIILIPKIADSRWYQCILFKTQKFITTTIAEMYGLFVGPAASR